MTVTIYWVTRDPKMIENTRKYFNIPHYMSLNGETEFEITEGKLKELRRGEPNFIQIRHIKK